MAAPVVAGTVALMLEANPKLTPNAVKAILQYTAQAASSDQRARAGRGPPERARRGPPREVLRVAHEPSLGDMGDSIEGEWVAVGAPHHLGQLPHHRRHAAARAATPGALSVTLGRAQDVDRCTVVWGARLDDNIVWSTDDDDNIVWSTGDDDNIVWSTDGDDNIVWSTDGDDNIVWSTDGDDNIVWSTGGDDNIVWSTDGDDNIVWSTGGDDNIVWSTGTRAEHRLGQ